MEYNFIELSSSSNLFSPQTGIEVLREDNRLEIACVNRRLIWRILNAIASIFGISTRYGIDRLRCSPKTGQENRGELQSSNIEELQKLVFLEIEHLKRPPISVPKRSDQIFNQLNENIVKANSVLIKLSLAKGLAEELNSKQYPEGNTNKPVVDNFYRDSKHVISNMVLALREYAKNGDLRSTIVPSNAHGQGATMQAIEVGATFLAALDKSLAMQKTMSAVRKKPENKQQLEVVEVCEKICRFISTLVKPVSPKTKDL